MKKNSRLFTLTPLSLAVSLALHASLAHAALTRFDIPDQPLDAALKRFEAQAGIRVVHEGFDAGSRVALRLQGDYEPEEALRSLVAGSDLVVERTDKGLRITRPSASALGVVKVTARRAEERALDVPFSVSAISGDTLERRRQTSLEDVLRDTPGVEVNSWGGYGDANVRMRGVGSLYQVSSEDSSVLINVDGAPMPAWNASLPVFDLERVEVLKGPQGTLMGRNSEAGAVNIVTRKPTQEADGYVRTEYGENGHTLLEGAVGGGLSETVSARVAARTSREDGLVKNVQSGDALMDPAERSLRGSVAWQPSASTALTLSSEYDHQKDRLGLMLLRPIADTPSADVTPGSMWADVTSTRHIAELTHDMGNMRLISNTSFQHRMHDQVTGADLNAAQALYGMSTPYLYNYHRKESVWNQDFRLSSLPGAEIFWVGGVNAFHAKRSYDTMVMTQANQREFKTTSLAAYGETTLPLAKDYSLTTGLRVTQDRKDYDAAFTSLYTGSTTTDSRTLTDRYATGRLALSHALGEHARVYGIYSRGHKAKGFSDETSGVDDGEPFKAARSHSFELGTKLEDPGQRWSLDAALFFNRVSDDHLLGYDYTTFATRAINLDTRSRGAELAAKLRLLRTLTLRGSVTYTDAQITRGASGVSGGDVNTGNAVPDVARWSGALALEHVQPLPGLPGLNAPRLNSSLAYRVSGKRYNDPQNHLKIDGLRNLDARAGIAAGSAEVYLWVNNILDRTTEQYVYYYAPDLSVGMPSRGRTAGVGLSYQFF